MDLAVVLVEHEIGIPQEAIAKNVDSYNAMVSSMKMKGLHGVDSLQPVVGWVPMTQVVSEACHMMFL